jgi:serine/threonine protein kinase
MSRLTAKQQEFLDNYIRDHRVLGRRKKKAAESFARRKGKIEADLKRLPDWSSQADLVGLLATADAQADQGDFKDAYKALKKVKQSARQRAAGYDPTEDVTRVVDDVKALFADAAVALPHYRRFDQYRKTPDATPDNAPDLTSVHNFLAMANQRLDDIFHTLDELDRVAKTAVQKGQLTWARKFIDTALTGKYEALAFSPTQFLTTDALETQTAMKYGAGVSAALARERQAAIAAAEQTTEEPRTPRKKVETFDATTVASRIKPLKDTVTSAADPSVVALTGQVRQEINQLIQEKGVDSDVFFDLTLKTRDQLYDALVKAKGWAAKQRTPGQNNTAAIFADEWFAAIQQANPTRVDTTNNEITLNGEVFDNPVQIAEGGSGVVYRYESQTTQGKFIAVKRIKRLSPNDYGQDAIDADAVEKRADLAEELRTNRLLQTGDPETPGRDNVLDLKGVGQGPADDGELYMVMEMASADLGQAKYGETAATESGAITEEARAVLNQYFFKQAVQGVKYLRDQGMVHFDLKEGNFMVMDDGTVKVADFGSTVLSGEASGAVPVPSDPNKVTQAYGAPEAIQGAGTTSTKADTHALGKMIQTMQRGAYVPKHGGFAHTYIDLKDLTGALKTLSEPMTSKTATERPTLEGILASPYVKNLDNYQEEDVQQLSAAVLAYGKALSRQAKNAGLNLGILTDDVKSRQEKIAALEHQLKDATLLPADAKRLQDELDDKRQELAPLEKQLKDLSNSPPVKPLSDRVKELSERLTRPMEKVALQSKALFIKQLRSVAGDSGAAFYNFVGLRTYADLFTEFGVDQKELMRVARHHELNLSETNAKAAADLTNAVAEINNYVNGIGHALMQPILRSGFKKLIVALQEQLAEFHPEAIDDTIRTQFLGDLQAASGNGTAFQKFVVRSAFKHLFPQFGVDYKQLTATARTFPTDVSPQNANAAADLRNADAAVTAFLSTVEDDDMRGILQDGFTHLHEELQAEYDALQEG